MRFYKLAQCASEPEDIKMLRDEYHDARRVGPVRVGIYHFFCKTGPGRVAYIEYGRITRCFRRVELVGAAVCCGKGALAIENFVVCTGEDEAETLQVRMPGERAGKILLETMEDFCPRAKIGAPEKKRSPEEVS